MEQQPLKGFAYIRRNRTQVNPVKIIQYVKPIPHGLFPVSRTQSDSQANIENSTPTVK